MGGFVTAGVGLFGSAVRRAGLGRDIVYGGRSAFGVAAFLRVLG